MNQIPEDRILQCHSVTFALKKFIFAMDNYFTLAEICSYYIQASRIFITSLW